MNKFVQAELQQSNTAEIAPRFIAGWRGACEARVRSDAASQGQDWRA